MCKSYIYFVAVVNYEVIVCVARSKNQDYEVISNDYNCLVYLMRNIFTGEGAVSFNYARSTFP